MTTASKTKATATKSAPAQSEADQPKMALRITAKPSGGFRRCGVHHPAEQVDHPEGRFSAAQIRTLKSEANLVVHEL
ncbi:HI1506-related protein [Labrenzia sp. PHM005]|uniref:HI1506-related protein n=1 Tax=Labrenzia sp. PHM005 TaxID=2590016 RepID=UPI00114013D1|nr:HI1506-related protein [Labrenzia sp. PHM005]QDG74450.1 hypothetical protein FJ695_00370 [Labrenzia sp. PHM005]